MSVQENLYFLVKGRDGVMEDLGLVPEDDWEAGEQKYWLDLIFGKGNVGIGFLDGLVRRVNPVTGLKYEQTYGDKG